MLQEKPAADVLGNALLRPALCMQTKACPTHSMQPGGHCLSSTRWHAVRSASHSCWALLMGARHGLRLTDAGSLPKRIPQQRLRKAQGSQRPHIRTLVCNSASMQDASPSSPQPVGLSSAARLC